MVTDTGKDPTITQKTSTATDRATAPAGQRLQSCICGWTKKTSEKGIKIHQDRRKCLRDLGKEPDTSHCFLRGKVNQLSEAKGQDNPHSPQSSSTPAEAQSDTYLPMNSSPEPKQPRPAAESRKECQKLKMHWLNSCLKKEWETTDTDLICLLEELKGCVERKLQKMGDAMNNYRAERF